MSRRFEELDRRLTPMGAIVLRRRLDPVLEDSRVRSLPAVEELPDVKSLAPQRTGTPHRRARGGRALSSSARVTRPSTARRPLRRLADRLLPGGVFALGSDDAPDAGFATVLEADFATSWAQTVAFPNPYTGGTSRDTVYVATRHQA